MTRVRTEQASVLNRTHHAERRAETARIARGLRTILGDRNPWPPHEMAVGPRYSGVQGRPDGHRRAMEGVR